MKASQLRPHFCVELNFPPSYVLLPPRALPREVYLATDINPHATKCTLATGVQNSVCISRQKLLDLTSQSLSSPLLSPRFQVAINPILTSLTTSLLPRLDHKIDILLFNPPYVPTSLAESVPILSSTSPSEFSPNVHFRRSCFQNGLYSKRAWDRFDLGWRRRWDGRDSSPAFSDRREQSSFLSLVSVETPAHVPFVSADQQELLSPIGVFYLVAIRQNKPLEIIASIRKKFEGRLDGKVGRVAFLSHLLPFAVTLGQPALTTKLIFSFCFPCRFL